MQSKIANYFGTFTGFSPSWASKLTKGEIQITIGENGIKFRHATGQGIDEAHFHLEHVRTLTEAEVYERLDSNPEQPGHVDGFQIGKAGAILLFWQNPASSSGFWIWRKPAEPRLIVLLGGLIDHFGVTFLYDEAQVANGDFEQVMKDAIRDVGEYPLPRLQYGGHCRPDPHYG
jgi:hypothetical protein